jgi:hypothetical protein
MSDIALEAETRRHRFRHHSKDELIRMVCHTQDSMINDLRAELASRTMTQGQMIAALERITKPASRHMETR